MNMRNMGEEARRESFKREDSTGEWKEADMRLSLMNQANSTVESFEKTSDEDEDEDEDEDGGRVSGDD